MSLIVKLVTSRRRGLLLKTLLVLVGFKVGLRVVPFGLLRKLVIRVSAPGLPDPRSPEDIAYAVRKVGHYILPDKACLSEALTAYVMLRRRGYPVRLHIGIRRCTPAMVMAHAWVELDHKVLVGGSRALPEFVRLPEILP